MRALDGYLTSQSAWLVNYAERHRAGLRVGTAITEGTANFLVNRRMNKSQQMRWSRRGADLLLQVRCAVYNGTLGSSFGQKFHPANDPCRAIFGIPGRRAPVADRHLDLLPHRKVGCRGVAFLVGQEQVGQVAGAPRRDRHEVLDRHGLDLGRLSATVRRLSRS